MKRVEEGQKPKGSTQQPQSIEQTLQLAVGHHTSGRLPEAEALYKQVLQAEPNQPVALHLLGVLAYQVGKSDAAVELISKAISFLPDYTEAHNNLGLALQELGKPDAAAESFQKALALKDDYPEAHHNLGNVYQHMGKPEEAVDCYQRAISLKPDYVKAYNNLGLAFKELGNLDDALDGYRQALDKDPNYAEAHNNLGNVLKDLGQLEEAVRSYNRALAINPNYAEAHNNLGLVFQDMGLFEEALNCYPKALSIKPDYAEALNNLGNVLARSGKANEAVEYYRKALAIRPDYAEAHNNLGNAFKELGRVEDAIGAYREALRITPDYEPASVNLLHQLRFACDWTKIGECEAKVRDFTKRAIQEGKSVELRPFDNATSCDDPSENLAVAKSQSDDIAKKMSGFRANFSMSARAQDKSKITIGYLSSDFQHHATAHLMLSLFELHDREDFNIFAFSHGPNDASDYRRKIEHDSDKFFDIQTLGHLPGAKTIYDSGVDILIDLKGHTGNNRLEICALRPAPVQVSYLGFPGTTGADFLDYFITDRIVTPEELVPFFSEQLVYMPHSYQINDFKQKISETPFVRSDFNLPEEGFVFCSFNGSFKIEPVIFEVWMNLLKKVPGSVLWLYRSNDVVEANLKYEAQSRGVDGDRLIFADSVAKDQHLARYRLADLALDTRICGGHTTTSDALWAGVPVVTMLGAHFASRVSASALSAVGIPELITHDLEEYEVLAFRLSQNPDELAGLKTKLSVNRLIEPLFDTPRFVLNLEKAYRQMWNGYLSDQTPSRIEVVEG